MEKILFVNACVRKNSRTLALARYILDKLKGEICEVCLEDEEILPLDGKLLEKREQLVREKRLSEDMFRYANDFAKADVIVIAAPYWDLTFPAILKIYLEQITISEITFKYENGVPKGLCRAKRMIYVTTAGGPIYYNFGFEYVKTLAQKFYGINEVSFFKAENLDIVGNDANEILQLAKEEVNL